MGGDRMSAGHHPVLWIGKTAVMTMPAEIDITNADQVREDLLSVLNQGATLLIADLSRTAFCDSAGVSALVRGFRRAEANQSDMRLVIGTLAVQRVLAFTGIDRLLNIYPSVAVALADLPDHAAGRDIALGGNVTTTADSDGGGA
jgi:anti-sigma B factor antagonist